jgi:hypothetical protein
MARATASILFGLCLGACGGASDSPNDSGASHDAAVGDAHSNDSTDAAGTDGAVAASDLAMFMGEPGTLGGITAAHNTARQNAMPVPSPALPLLTWSDTLAQTAQSWAGQCMFKHSGTSGLGENIYASAGFTPTGAEVVMNWVSESANYDYGANSCSGTCGHYTQVVWRATTQLGCGLQACSQNSPFMGFSNWTMVVCNYTPPGNDGSRPY